MITLYSIVKSLKELMAAMPNAGLILDNDIYELNHRQDVDYPAYCITQQQHVQDVDNEYLTYRFYLFYVDRLVSDKSNDLDVQSAGIQALKTIVTTMENNGAIVEQCSYNTFNQRFNDECAGAFCDVTFKVSADSCASFEISTSDIELISKTITSNGSYRAPSGYAYSALTINVPTTTIDLKSIVINSNGTYTSSGDTAYSAVTVNVSSTTINNQDLTIVQNGSYEAASGYTGLGNVVVNVPQTELQSIEINSNGTYESEDGYAYSAISVNVPSDVNNQDLTIVENGSYEAASGYSGLGTVVVNVPQTELQSVELTANGTYEPASGTAYSAVTVSVPQTELQSIEINSNGTYTSSGNTAYSEVVVNVPSVTTMEITQAEYDALTEYNPYIIYLITE